MEEEVPEASDSDSAASADSQLARCTKEVVVTPPDGVTQEEWQETLSTIESEVSKAWSGFESRASTSRNVGDDSSEEEE